MTDCGCDKAKAELEEFLHNELSPEQCQDIRDHMAVCDDCSAEHLVGLTLTNKVKEACQEKAPDELRELVLGALELNATAMSGRRGDASADGRPGRRIPEAR